MSPLRNSSHGTLWRYVSLGRRPAPKLQLRSRCYGAAAALLCLLFSLSFPFPHISHAKKRVKFATCFAGELWQEASEQKRWKVLNQRAEKSNNIPEKLKRKIQFLPFLDLATVDSRHQYIHSSVREVPWDNQCNVLSRIFFFFYKKVFCQRLGW